MTVQSSESNAPVPSSDAAIRVGSVAIPGRLALAPMAGYSNLPYRLLARRYGAALTTTEMVSAKALAIRNEKTLRLLDHDAREIPSSAQVFGADARDLAGSAQAVASLGFDLVDVNMGCPVPKITGGGGGCALMTEPKKAAELLGAMVKESPIPVTAKIRAGWDDSSRNAPEVAKALEDVGVAAITVHGRTRAQMYSGRADRSLIAAVKRAVRVPVFGNGDVVSPEEALAMLAETGVDGIAIGRGALGRPWIFAQIQAALCGAPVPAPPALPEMGEILLELMQGVVTLYGEPSGMRIMRRLASDFSKGIPGGARFRDACVRVSTREELIAIVRATLKYDGPVPASPVAAPEGGPLPLPEPGGG